ncbi:MAG TPA: hypothetical protein VEQ34_12955 [Pyrinomonadaceae bacterium]|nr:hypothetical protein [Pyrinomonadaceae bacterium]
MILKNTKNIEPIQAQESLEKIFKPQLQVEKTRQMLNEVLRCANEDLGNVTNRKARTLLETTIALAQGLIKAFEHYEGFWTRRDRRKVFKRLN